MEACGFVLGAPKLPGYFHIKTALTKNKGMHKHFRMIAISQHLRNHGYTSAKDDHTRIPGIWEKLGKYYNLDALDERVGRIMLGGAENG